MWICAKPRTGFPQNSELSRQDRHLYFESILTALLKLSSLPSLYHFTSVLSTTSQLSVAFWETVISTSVLTDSLLRKVDLARASAQLTVKKYGGRTIIPQKMTSQHTRNAKQMHLMLREMQNCTLQSKSESKLTKLANALKRQNESSKNCSSERKSKNLWAGTDKQHSHKTPELPHQTNTTRNHSIKFRGAYNCHLKTWELNQ